MTGRGDLLLTRPGGRPGGPGQPAPKPTRSCWRSSTTCSCPWPSRWVSGCRAPRTRSTSRNGSTSPARSSTRPGSSSPTPRTCRCTWAPWARASRWSCSRNRGDMKPGDVFMLNDPYHGGTHLPDITVVTPVFGEAAPEVPGRPGQPPGHPVLRGLPRASRRDRRHHARLDAGLQHPGRRGRRAHRQLAAGRRRRAARGRHHGPAHLGRVPVPQPRRQPRGPAGADRREREGRGRAAGSWSASSAWTW